MAKRDERRRIADLTVTEVEDELNDAIAEEVSKMNLRTTPIGEIEAGVMGSLGNLDFIDVGDWLPDLGSCKLVCTLSYPPGKLVCTLECSI